MSVGAALEKPEVQKAEEATEGSMASCEEQREPQPVVNTQVTFGQSETDSHAPDIALEKETREDPATVAKESV